MVLLVLFFFGQHGTSSYAVTAQGSTLYIDGPFESGISREVAGALRSQYIEQVVLDSPGGLLVEGEAIASMIKQLELDTVVDDHCASACTIAFTAGSNRILKHGGELGFHGASYDGVWVEPTSTVVNDPYRIGASLPFIPEAYYQTPPGSMWVPEPQILASNGITTHYISPNGRLFNV